MTSEGLKKVTSIFQNFDEICLSRKAFIKSNQNKGQISNGLDSMYTHHNESTENDLRYTHYHIKATFISNGLLITSLKSLKNRCLYLIEIRTSLESETSWQIICCL